MKTTESWELEASTMRAEDNQTSKHNSNLLTEGMCGLWAAGRPSSVVATREKSEENKTAESRGKTRVATPGTGKLCQEADPGPAHSDGPLAGLDGLLFESRPPQPLADTATQPHR